MHLPCSLFPTLCASTSVECKGYCLWVKKGGHFLVVNHVLATQFTPMEL